jgi:hypothetical protein
MHGTDKPRLRYCISVAACSLYPTGIVRRNRGRSADPSSEANMLDLVFLALGVGLLLALGIYARLLNRL